MACGPASNWRRHGWAAGLVAAALIAGCSSEPTGGVPESSQSADEQLAERHMVAAANPESAEVAREVLRAGGNAMDAAVAVQMALTLLEPPESGIGGGSFLIYRDAATGEVTVHDGREVAPAAAEPDRFMVLGLRRPLWSAVPAGLGIGVPGTVAMLHQAHLEHGSQPWEDLFQPTIRMADEGVPMPPRLREQVKDDFSLRLFGDTRRYFVQAAREDAPRLHNPDLADTLRLIADEGPEAFYSGAMAEDIVAAARGRWPGRSDMTVDDLADYSPERRNPVCGSYRGYTLCGPPPPSSGGLAVLQILGALEHFDMGSMEPGSADAWHHIAEASRLAWADRFYYVGDPAFVQVPVDELLDAEYLEQRAGLIDPSRAMDEAHPGRPGVRPEIEEAPEPIDEETTGTSHFSIVDAEGNIASMTTSIEVPFGSRTMVNGFLLNNQLTDFTFRPVQNGFPVPNAVGPGKRPRSSMSPFIVWDRDGEVRLVIGSRGGSRIIGYVAKAMIGVLDWDLTVQEAISLPNMVYRGEGVELERGTALTDLRSTLESMGHDTNVTTMESGIHGIEWIDDRWRGGADPRIGGVAVGD